MTERRGVPAPSDQAARGGRSHRRRRGAPGLRTAAALSLSLGVTAAVLVVDGGPDAEVGTPASIAAPRDTSVLAGPAGRGSRSEPRGLPPESSTPTMPPAGTLAPTRTTPAAPGTTADRPTTAASPAGPADPASTPPPKPATRAPAGDPATSITRQVIDLTNAERATKRCGPLHEDARLTAAAQGHSEDMSARNYFAHNTPEGTTPWDRAAAAGYPDSSAENIAMGYRTARAVVDGWMNSPGHAANILNCESHAVGIGLDQDGFYWTQLFGFK
jgi:uncharacterized protein YkwD